MELTFPHQLDTIKNGVLAQAETLQTVASLFARAIANGGLVHVYANGHSRMATEELVIRMGALTGFRAILSPGLTTFTDVIGPAGVRLNQQIERKEGLGKDLLDEMDIGADDVFVVVFVLQGDGFGAGDGADFFLGAQNGFHCGAQLVGELFLPQKVVGAQFHGLDDGAGGREAGGDEDHGVRVQSPDAAQ